MSGGPGLAVSAAVATVVALALTAAPPAAADATEPTQDRSATPAELSAAVHVWDPSGGSVHIWDPSSGSVHIWDLEDAVSTLEEETTEGDTTVLTLDSDILFEFGSAAIPETAQARVVDLVQPAGPGAPVAVTGHTDSLGDDAANLLLSQQRAEAVATAIRGARPDLVLDVQGLGETQPVKPNSSGGQDDPVGRAANRRVELRF